MSGVETIKKFMKEQILQWFRYVERIDNERAPIKTKKIVDDGLKKVFHHINYVNVFNYQIK